MKIGYVKKGLTIGIIILFVFVGISSVVAINKLSSDNVELKDTFSYIGNDPPYKPNIYGPSNGSIYVKHTFYTDEITDPEGDRFNCWWDWGDGNNSDWLGPYNSGEIICESHIWTEAGVYYIKLKLKDDGGWESDWSDPFEITIFENQPPSAPLITGPRRGKPVLKSLLGTKPLPRPLLKPGTYNFTFKATDPDGDQVRYLIDWCDCKTDTTDLYPSGTNVTISHTWSYKGVYTVIAKAQDEHGLYGPESTWDEPIPKLHTKSYRSIFNQLKNNSSNVESAEDLPDLKIVEITSYVWFYPTTDVIIKNIGNAPINDNVSLIMYIYRGFGISPILIDTVGPNLIEMNIAPGDEEWIDLYPDWPNSHFLRFAVHVNYDKKVIESNYNNNLAVQRYYIGFFNLDIWMKIGPITYPLLFLYQLGI